MNRYANIVINIIKEDGTHIAVDSSANDAKHIMAYERLILQEQNDGFHIHEYEETNKISTLTGFEISKYIAAQNNIVFFIRMLGMPF